MSNFETIVKGYTCRNAATLAAIPAPVARPEGRIWTDTGRMGTFVFVAFSKSAPAFNDYLNSARALKHAFPGSPGWSKDDLAWVYPVAALGDVVATFPTFDKSALNVTVPAGKPVDTTPPAVDGTITKNYSQVLVQWPARHPDFGRFLDTARRLKASVGARYNDGLKGWLVDARHLPAVAAAFPTFKVDSALGTVARQPAYSANDDRRQDWHPDPSGPDMGDMADEWLANLS